MDPQDVPFVALGVNNQLVISDLFSEFKFATWSVWRSGQLSELSPSFAKQAARGYEDFLRVQSISPEFFAAHPPRPGEILLSISRAAGNPGMVIKSQRLWLYNDQRYSEFNLSDIAKFTSTKTVFGASVAIILKDNTRQEYSGIPVKPNDQFIARAGRPFLLYMFIGAVIGSIAGAFVLNGSMIGSFALLGILLGYIVWQLKSMIGRSG